MRKCCASLVWVLLLAVPLRSAAQTSAVDAAKQAAATAQAAMTAGSTSVPTGTVHYYYTDPQGTVLAEADAQGNITARYDYAPYGIPAASLGSPPDGPGYTGHVNDPDTGLVYMQARYYDPQAGRFLSIDPVEPMPGNVFNFNRYSYASNNPIVNIDPDGRFAEDPEQNARMNNWGGWGNQTFWRDARCSICLSTGGAAQATTLPAVNVTATAGQDMLASGGPGGFQLFPPSLFIAQDPVILRPMLEPVKPLPPGAPIPQLPEDFPQLPTNPSESPGKGWEWRGPDAPGGSRGAWYNAAKKWTLHPDMQHPEPIGPHWDWIDENGNKFRITPSAPPVTNPGVA